jgi:hypothetical protein
MTGAAPTVPPREGTCCRILELRRYVLEPGQREVMIELFDRCFVESQEELGIRVVGQFRVRGQPDLFAWIRGFPDMPSRARSLEAFYGESVAWRRNRDAANATMIDFSNVLLLKPAGRSRGFALNPLDRPGPEAPDAGGGVIVAAIHASSREISDELIAEFESDFLPELRRSGMAPLAHFVTEPSVNTFPRLPVREGENVFAWFAASPDGAGRTAPPSFAGAGLGEPEVLELEPTRRSLLRAT